MPDLPEGYLYDYDADPARPTRAEADVADEREPGTDQPNPSPARNTTAQLQAIVDRHKAAFEARGHDYRLVGWSAPIPRGTPEHAAVFGRRQPQWHNHVASFGRKGVRIIYRQAIRSEAIALLGPEAAAAIDSLL